MDRRVHAPFATLPKARKQCPVHKIRLVVVAAAVEAGEVEA